MTIPILFSFFWVIFHLLRFCKKQTLFYMETWLYLSRCYADVDGQKLWRVFDNLIGNILKYSLENTRVYISMKSLQDQVLIVFKNVAKYELGEDVDELFKRFKRGDTSRHTEGSGLGLAIAKSIVDLHSGSLEIELDGDLFKVTVALNMHFL
jgi:signal transduction histidine kinase